LGIHAWYKPEELPGKTVALVANLKPVKLRGVESYGMILACDIKDETGERAAVIFLDDEIPAGARIR
jgi:methionyl-tRNA synthetase